MFLTFKTLVLACVAWVSLAQAGYDADVCPLLMSYYKGGSLRLRKLLEKQARLLQLYPGSGINRDILEDIRGLKTNDAKRVIHSDGQVTASLAYESKDGNLTISVGTIKAKSLAFGESGPTDRTFARFLSTILRAVSERKTENPARVKDVILRATDVINPGLQEILPSLGFERIPRQGPPELQNPSTGQMVPVYDYELRLTETPTGS